MYKAYWKLQEQYEKNMHGLVGSLFDSSEEQDIPLLYFNNPIQAFKWVTSWAIPGLGMFSEAYFIFSIGNIKPILADQYPACWSKYTVICSYCQTLLPLLTLHFSTLTAKHYVPDIPCWICCPKVHVERRCSAVHLSCGYITSWFDSCISVLLSLLLVPSCLLSERHI